MQGPNANLPGLGPLAMPRSYAKPMSRHLTSAAPITIVVNRTFCDPYRIIAITLPRRGAERCSTFLDDTSYRCVGIDLRVRVGTLLLSRRSPASMTIVPTIRSIGGEDQRNSHVRARLPHTLIDNLQRPSNPSASKDQPLQFLQATLSSV